jgi:hypothetical protein
MTNHACGRCEFESRTRRELLDHAEQTGHPLCGGCGGRSLQPHQPNTCTACAAEAHALLSGILTMGALLPSQLGVLRDRRASGGSDEFALPGGEVLNLLGPGGSGDTSDDLRDAGPSLNYQLELWRIAWNDRYLERGLTWAIVNTHIDGYLHEARQLHERLARALNMGPIRSQRVGLRCIALIEDPNDPDQASICRGVLIRPKREVHVEQEGQRWYGEVVDPDDPVICSSCRRLYGPLAIKLAQAENARDRARVIIDEELYATEQVLAHDLGRPVKSIRNWIRQGLLTTWTSRGLRFVHVGQATDLHATAGVRARRSG